MGLFYFLSKQTGAGTKEEVRTRRKGPFLPFFRKKRGKLFLETIALGSFHPTGVIRPPLSFPPPLSIRKKTTGDT